MSKSMKGKEGEERRSVEKVYQDKNTIVEITVHTKPKRVSCHCLFWLWIYCHYSCGA
jgi:hypothetical protein